MLNKSDIIYTSALLLLVGLLLYLAVKCDTANTQLRQYNHYQDSIRYYKDRYDQSLIYYDNLLDEYNSIVNELDNKQDSIITKYKVIYEQMETPSIIDDDSVLRYITRKIHNQ